MTSEILLVEQMTCVRRRSTASKQFSLACGALVGRKLGVNLLLSNNAQPRRRYAELVPLLQPHPISSPRLIGWTASGSRIWEPDGSGVVHLRNVMFDIATGAAELLDVSKYLPLRTPLTCTCIHNGQKCAPTWSGTFHKQ